MGYIIVECLDATLHQMPWCNIYTLYRFFGTESLDDSSTDLTPTDADSEQLKPFSRKLYDNKTEDSSDEIQPPSPPPVTSGSCLRKRLFPSAINEKLCKYAFGGGSKRQRIEGQDQGADIPAAKPIRSNPFAIASSLSQQSLLSSDNDASMSDFEERSSRGDVEHDRPSNCASENRYDLSSTTCTSSHGGTSRMVFCRNEENIPLKNSLSHSTVVPIGDDDTDCMSVLQNIANPQAEQKSINTQSSFTPVQRKNLHQKALTNPVC